jgi:hypothetical protein
MKNNRVKIALIALFCAVIGYEVWQLRTTHISSRQLSSPVAQKNKPDFTLLPTSETASFAHFFAEPGFHVESWEPTVADINGAEANLSQISALSNRVPGGQIDNPNQYFRQYLAVSVNGKKSIFLNAFCADYRGHENDWRRRLVFAKDGGKCFWHASYESSTGRFSDLSINGDA